MVANAPEQLARMKQLTGCYAYNCCRFSVCQLERPICDAGVCIRLVRNPTLSLLGPTKETRLGEGNACACPSTLGDSGKLCVESGFLAAGVALIKALDGPSRDSAPMTYQRLVQAQDNPFSTGPSTSFTFEFAKPPNNLEVSRLCVVTACGLCTKAAGVTWQASVHSIGPLHPDQAIHVGILVDSSPSAMLGTQCDALGQESLLYSESDQSFGLADSVSEMLEAICVESAFYRELCRRVHWQLMFACLHGAEFVHFSLALSPRDVCICCGIRPPPARDCAGVHARGLGTCVCMTPVFYDPAHALFESSAPGYC